jgi:DNA repair protein RecN (Recombination protein N)
VDAADELIEKEKFLSHAEEVIRELSQANQILSEDEPSVNSQINETVNGLSRIVAFFEPAKQLLERLENLEIEFKDIASEIELSLGRIHFNPGDLQEVTSKLDIIYRLQQKYNVQSVKALIEIRDDFAEQLENTISLEEEIEALSEKNTQLKKEVSKLAGLLHKSRSHHAPLFEKSITKVLTQLGMKAALLRVNIDNQDRFSENGCDSVRFLFNANKGGTANEISKIASGGELSRLMLAVKSLISKENLLPTVIFDEIDAGVSGEIAGKVGNILKQMAVHHQLMVISHLPQIASKANTHLLVTKLEEDSFTHSQISLLDVDGRVDEIAKMMSDEKVSRAAKQTAKELLNQQH